MASRDVSIAIDLAFIMRIQRFLLGLQIHSERNNAPKPSTSSLYDDDGNQDSRGNWKFPDIETNARQSGFAINDSGSRRIYFEGLTILPCTINLSVAPARALTLAQANLEGNEAAAIHAAVRKGDILIGNGTGVLDVKIGGKNRTTLSVIRGVFKSILVDALLRCDGASMSFSGVVIRNVLTSGPQLKAYLLAHYLDALRNNVPSLLGSLSAIGNPIRLVKGLGDGVRYVIGKMNKYYFIL